MADDKKILPEHLGFCGRITKSADDPINQCLNYLYGILYGEVWKAVAKAGLDPYFGLMHGSKTNHGSLIFDLIEEFRAPFADRILISMVGRGFIPERREGKFIKISTRKKLVKNFKKRWSKKVLYRSNHISASRLLSNQAASLVTLFRDKEKYHHYRMKR